MSDPETPAFQVVDRRASAQASAQPTEAFPADTSSPNVGTSPAAPVYDASVGSANAAPSPDSMPGSTADTGLTATEQFEQDINSGDDIEMPDPAALLPYVAMQMDVRGLAGTMLGVFDAQAWRALGLVANPMTGQTEKNLPDAQLAIDCVQFLLGKMESALDDTSRREMHRRLNDLRMNYLAKVREG